MEPKQFVELMEKLSVGPGLSNEITHTITVTQIEMKALSASMKICHFLNTTGLMRAILEEMPKAPLSH